MAGRSMPIASRTPEGWPKRCPVCGAEWRIEPEHLHQRHKLTPYAGQVVKGVVEATYLKGRKIYERGEFLSTPRGEILLSA